MKKNRVILTVLCCIIIITMVFILDSWPALSQAAEEVEHRVVKGDDLHLLAGYYYRDPRRWGEIYRANKGEISNPNLIKPGMILTIPERGLETFPLAYSQWRARVSK